MQVNVHEAKSQLSRLLELVEEGETVIIARHGQPVAELIPAKRPGGFPFGIARQEPLVPPGDEWWQPMSDAEAEEWCDRVFLPCPFERLTSKPLRVFLSYTRIPSIEFSSLKLWPNV